MKPITERSYGWLLWTLALTGLVCDQASKYGVFAWLYQNEAPEVKHELIPNAFELLTQRTDVRVSADAPNVLRSLQTIGGDLLPRVNHGALFGLGGEYKTLANGTFAVISVLAVLAILYWSTLASTTNDAFLCAALGLILAGTLGNLYDRVVFNGVRDFLHWFYAFEWPVFNLADCCLVCGAFLLLTQAFWVQSPEESSSSSQIALKPNLVEAK